MTNSTDPKSPSPKYEPPSAVRLSDSATGVGQCVNGSGDQGGCGNGTLPYGYCDLGFGALPIPPGGRRH